METIKLYYVRRWGGTQMVDEQGEGFSYLPYVGRAEDGDDDGGVEYVVPEGYEVALCNDEIVRICDSSGRGQEVFTWRDRPGIVDDDGKMITLRPVQVYAIAALIRDKRTELGLTQQQLGEKIGYVGRNAELMIQAFEAVRRPIPQPKLKPLADALDLNLEDLLP